MASGDGFGLGYRDVDEDPNLAFLIDTMDETGRWGATRDLRAWERRHLQLDPGDRLLDVGCGAGDAVLALAADLGPTGAATALDVSAAMVSAARARSAAAPVSCTLTFDVGDVRSLDLPAGSFDAVRAERTLQWVADPAAAIGQLTRVLRPGGRISLIDTDWSTLELDVADETTTAAVTQAMASERNRPSNVGRRLAELVRDAGFTEVIETSATHVCTQWNPHTAPAPAGFFSMSSLAEDLVAAGSLDSNSVDGFLDTVTQAADMGHFSMRLTMFAVAATAPNLDSIRD